MTTSCLLHTGAQALRDQAAGTQMKLGTEGTAAVGASATHVHDD